MKRILPVLIVVLSLVFSVIGFAYQNRIADDADLFSDYEETEILYATEDFSAEKGFSLAVVTTDFTSGLSSEEYADDYYDYLIDNEGFQEDGMLFLIDMYNSEVWISTSGECILAYNDSEIDDIIDSGYNNLSNGNYAQCILEMTEYARNTDTVINPDEDYYIGDESLFGDSFFSASTVVINGETYYIDENGEWISAGNDEYYDDYNYDYDYDYGSSYNDTFKFSDFLVYVVIGLAVGGVSVFIVKSRYKNQGKGDEFDSDDVILNITASNDTVISKNVITTRIPKNNNINHGGSGGGGISRGGSSVHRSGGGRPHGGGGRRF